MPRRQFGPIKTYRIVAEGLPSALGGSPPQFGAQGLSAFLIAIWWFLTGVPEKALPPDETRTNGNGKAH